MVERQLPKLHTRVRFPSPAPIFQSRPSHDRPREKSAGSYRRTRSRALRNLIEKAGDRADAAFLQHRKIGALDRAVDAVGTKAQEKRRRSPKPFGSPISLNLN